MIPEDLEETFGTTKLASGETIARADAVNPDEEERFEEVMGEVYDPSREFQTTETGEDTLPNAGGVGGHRRRTLEAIEQKDRLGAISDVESLHDITEAVREIQLDSPRYMTPQEGVIEILLNIHGRLPEDAQPHYVQDSIILRRINAARNQFNDWLGRLKREKEIPSPVEAGPANYPVKKAKDTSRYEREAKEELNEKIDKIAAGARGDMQRALEAIGSSVAEFNEQESTEQAAEMRDRLAVGDIVQYRDPNLHIGGVVRVNQKSVRVSRPNEFYPGTKPMSDEPEPEFRESRIALDSGFLEKIPPEELPEFEDFPDTLEAAQMETMGRVVNGQDQDAPDTPDTQPITESMVSEEVAGWSLLEIEDDKATWSRPDEGPNEEIEEQRMNVRRFPRQGEGGGYHYEVSTSLYGFDKINQEEGFVSKTTHKEGGFGGDPEAAIEYAEDRMLDNSAPAPDTGQSQDSDIEELNIFLENQDVPIGAALNLQQHYDGIEDLHQAWTAAEDPTDIKGIGEDSAAAAGAALDEIFDEPAPDVDLDADQHDLKPVFDPVEGWSLEVDDSDRVVWSGENPPGAPAIIPRDEKVEAEVEATESNGEWSARVIWAGHGPVGITDGVLDVDTLEEQSSKEVAVGRAVEFMLSHPVGKRELMDRDKDPEELPWYARKYLSGAWGQYKGSISDAITAKDTLETERDEAEQAAAEINEIRDSYGQEPIDFEGLAEVQESGPSDPVPADIDHSFEWKPYDPSEELKV